MKIVCALSLAGCGVVLFSCAPASPPRLHAGDVIIGSRSELGGGQTSVMSLHSLAIEPGVTVMLPVDKQKQFSPAAMVEHTDAPESHLRVETFDARLDAAQMRAIRTAVDELTGSIGAQFSNRLSVYRAEAERRAAATAEDESRREAEEARKAEDRRRMEELQNERLRLESLRKAIEKAAEGQVKDTEIEALSTMRQPSDIPPPAGGAPQAPPPAERQETSARRAAAEDAITKANDTVRTTDEELKQLQRDLTSALSMPNVVVFRWNAGEAEAQGFNLLGAASGQSDTKRKESGYAVMNGLRRVRLVVGKDFENVAGQAVAATAMAELARNQRLVQDKRGVVVTSVLQTRQLMYFTSEDLDEQLRARLDIEAETLASGLTPAELKELKLKLSQDLLRLRSIQSSGYFDSPRVDMIPIAEWRTVRNSTDKPLLPHRGEIGDAVGQVTDSSTDPLAHRDWITVHAVTTTVQELLAQRVAATTAGR